MEGNITYVRYVPIFGDIHGNIEGLVNTVKYLNDKYGRLPFAFQVGDFGYFKNLQRLNADIKFKKEKGVYNYLSDKTVARKLLNETNGFELYFIRGNHEEQELLKHFEFKHPNRITSADDKEFLYYFPSGSGMSLPLDPLNDFIISGLGGIDKNSRPKKFSKNPWISFSDEEIDRLLAMAPIDILLTHQGPDYAVKGSKEINILSELLQPKVHVFGHAHKYYPARELNNGKTTTIGLSKMPLAKRPYLSSNDFYTVLDLEKLR